MLLNTQNPKQAQLYQLKSLSRPKLVFSTQYHSPESSPQHQKTPDLTSLIEFLQKNIPQNGSSHTCSTIVSSGTEPSSSSAVQYFKQELTVDGLNAIHSHLWIAGSKGNISPLHRQIMMGRTIVITEDPEMHLVWNRGTIFIKPLPPFLVTEEFWKILNNGGDDHERLRHLAYGFLKSYSRLIAYRSDFKIAKDLGLIPHENLEFEAWFNFLHHTVIYRCQPNSVNMRYWYGELRLDRLNWIYRLFKFQYVYLSLDTSYDQYFSRWWSFILFVVAWISIALTALQVLLAARPENQVYSGISNAIALWALFLCVVLVGGAYWLYLLMFTSSIVKVLRRQLSKPYKEWGHLV